MAALLLVFAELWFCTAQLRPASASSDERDGAPAMDRLTFAIPAQSLEDALIVYAAATGAEVFVDHALVAARRSEPVQGVYSLEGALRRMLAGTGLDIRRAAPRAYILVAMPLREPPSDWSPRWATDRNRSRFFVALQTALKRTLCAQSELGLGQYRAALAVWIDSTGRIVEARLLNTDIPVSSSHGLLNSIKGVSIGEPPPIDLQQPVSLVILPRSPERTGDCAS